MPGWPMVDRQGREQLCKGPEAGTRLVYSKDGLGGRVSRNGERVGPGAPWGEDTGLTLGALTSRGESGQGQGTGAEQDGSAVLDSAAPGCPLTPGASGGIQSWTEIQACSVPTADRTLREDGVRGFLPQ